jgi:DNA-directed RNA polymerase subunit omega
MLFIIWEGDFSMLHPSYSDLMAIVNSDVEPGEQPVIKSRYSIVLATAKRARQLINGAEPLLECDCSKPLSIAVKELYEGMVRIVVDDDNCV